MSTEANSIMNSPIVQGLITGIVSGFLSCFLFYLFINYIDNKKWNKAKKQLVEQLNISLNCVLGTVRSLLKIQLPLNIASNEDLISFISTQMLDNFDKKYYPVINNWSSNEWRLLNLGMRNTQDALRQLSVLFVNFRTADSWYIEVIFTLQMRVFDVAMAFLTVPEIGEQKHQEDNRVKSWKLLASNNIYKLCKYVNDTKNDALIKDVVGPLFPENVKNFIIDITG